MATSTSSSNVRSNVRFLDRGNQYYGLITKGQLKKIIDNGDLPNLAEVKREAKKQTTIFYSVILVIDKVTLWRFGPRGGHNRIWSFGNINAIRRYFSENPGNH